MLGGWVPPKKLLTVQMGGMGCLTKKTFFRPGLHSNSLFFKRISSKYVKIWSSHPHSSTSSLLKPLDFFSRPPPADRGGCVTVSAQRRCEPTAPAGSSDTFCSAETVTQRLLQGVSEPANRPTAPRNLCTFSGACFDWKEGRERACASSNKRPD